MILSGTSLQSGVGHAGGPVAVAKSELMQDVFRLASRTAARGTKVLITGESGVGKDVVARFIHMHSPRAHRPFIAVNCAGLTESLLESELFGHVKGSFTGAHRDMPGKLELANHGTIFLDEVGEMTPRMQALLLRFLESGEVQPVGAGYANRRIDARVITATNRHLSEMVAAGTFREDLLYRIRVIQIHVPPLRQRTDDIRPLANHFLERLDPTMRMTEASWTALQCYPWPGNVRELQSVMEQLASLPTGSVIEAEDLPSALSCTGAAGPRPNGEARRDIVEDVFAGLIGGSVSFWDEVYKKFMDRDLTREDLRQLVARGLANSSGNYRDLVRLFRLPDNDYKRLSNFLTRHGCAVDYRPFRRSRREPIPQRVQLASVVRDEKQFRIGA